METLELVPDEASYSVTPVSEVLAVELAGGPSRYRRDQLGSVARVSVVWTLDADDYADLLDFHQSTTDHGTEWFLIDLPLGGADPAEYTVHFVPGSLQLKSKDGGIYVVGADLEVLTST
ncbi:MAG: hypothetical protein WCK73_10340 [Deltaproteobacteria bacterium]